MRDRERAMHLFKALETIDEKLLERSEQETGAGAFFPMKYAKVIAACFCCVVLGAGLWAVYRVQDKTYDSAATAEHMEMIQENASVEGYPEQKPEEQPRDKETGKPEQSMAARESLATGSEDMGTTHQESTPETLASDNDSMGKTHRELTLEQAYEVADLGAYLPDTVPQGYLLESCRLYGTQQLSATWTKGLDYLSFTIIKTEVPPESFIDLTVPESYDVHLYDIPYGETVPEQYREAFNNPIFKGEELTPAVIEDRMKTMMDSGDTPTPKGNFAVFYEEGILVEFRGCGEPDTVWQMFRNIG